MEAIRSIMKEYGIMLDQTEQVSPRLYKVSVGQDVYALKKSRLTKNTVEAWEQVYHQAHARQLSAILPVFLTQQSRLYAADDDAYYYLTPWVPDAELTHEKSVRHTFEAIGDLHARTKTPISIDINSVKHYFNDYQKINTERRHELIRSIDQFEQSRYMSPFELQVCTHYRVLVKVFTELNYHIDHFIEELELNSDWHCSLCHRHLTLPHVRHNRDTLFLNWEYAAYDHPVVDLAMLFHGMAKTFDENLGQVVSLFPVYNQQNPLMTSEQHLLAIHLLDPAAYISLVDDYVQSPRQQTMIERTQQLEIAFRQLNAGLAWSDFMAHAENSYEDSAGTET
ncbi:spore coat protein CotN [Barrientosiimonas marina]|uniref:Phosphotransferase n=1 Tax=Lentibacillus kimchii TaxID=1542911 RepID=A0ABW2UXJ4_9BACI